MSKKLNHALHNERACRYLHASGEFPDWVITTAFYSAIHFVDGHLFPNQYELPRGQVKNCTSMDDYYKKCCRDSTLSKHEMRMHLVEDHFPEIAPAFKWLKEGSSHLRYVDYVVEDGEPETALKYLDEIRDLCA